MRNGKLIKLISFSIFVSLVFLLPLQSLAEAWLYEDGGSSTFAAILCHGKGGDPESYVVDPLRLELNEQLGFHTASLQMPGGRKALVKYKTDFPEANEKINSAVDFLQKKGVTSIVLIAHSLGSRMATAYLADTPHPAIKNFVGVGMLNNGGPPFDCLMNLQNVSIPVLDIWGEAGKAGDEKYALERKILLSPLYIQVSIPDGDHALSEHEDELVKEVVTWLKMQNIKSRGE